LTTAHNGVVGCTFRPITYGTGKLESVGYWPCLFDHTFKAILMELRLVKADIGASLKILTASLELLFS